MTNSECVIDTFKICRNEHNAVLILNGSFTYVPGTLRMFVNVDGQKRDAHAFILPKDSGNGPVTHSFEIELNDIPSGADQIELVLLDNEGVETTLFTSDHDTNEAHTIASSIIYHLLSVTYGDNGVGMALGWAYSSYGSEVSFAMKDETGKDVPVSLRRTVQQRLRERQVVEEAHSLCGFMLSFPGTPEHTYDLILKDQKQEITISLGKYTSAVQQPSVGFMRFVRMIKLSTIRRAFNYLKKNGFVKFLQRLPQGVEEEIDYHAWFLRNRASAYDLKKQREHLFAYNPKISIIVPTFNTPEDLLHEMIDSVVNQSYSNWELCIADGSAPDNKARAIIKEYEQKEPRIKVTYLTENYGISGNTNKALELATGDYTSLFDHDDVLELDALYEIVSSLQEVHHDIIYTDEDKLDDETGRFKDPNFKPDYDKDLFLTHNYITHFFVVKTEIIKNTGGFDSHYDGAQDYDIMFKCIEQSQSIHHIRKSLYHWRMHAGSTALNPESKMYCYVAGQNAVHDHLQRMGIETKVEMLPKPLFGMYHVIYQDPQAKVSIIIPNKDHADILKTCMDSLLHVNTYENIEVIIVENNSEDKATFAYYDEIQKADARVKVVTWVGKEFNYSALNNFGVKAAAGEYYLFLNNDTEIISPDAIREMVSMCARDDIGVVGAKLLYADNTIQHAGVVVGFSGYAGHIFTEMLSGKEYGYMTRDMANGDLCAVTGACMLTKKSVYEEVEGFDEQFKVACNDIDYCLKVIASGKLVAYNAFALWHHYESKSRGYENGFDKVVRFDEEVDRWQKKWMELLIAGDPYYNQNFRIEDGPFILQ
jgi:GT2 family glycosyltransferase